ncbi:MAG: hypothetical protein H6754_00405 [Candidatus Omnitrophica bacterium]|nr:hypothetical protein [Candidatus Omnitrophota bacterium]
MSAIYVLGINVSHDISACLVKNGALVTAIAEERLNRVKRFTGGVDQEGMTNKHIPHLAIQYCLSSENIDWKDLALIVVSTCVVVNYQNYHIRSLTKEEILAQLPAQIDSSKVHLIDHHIGHAASVFYPSPFQDAVVLISDGGGSLVSTDDSTKRYEERISIYHGQGNELKVLKQYFDGVASPLKLANPQHCSLGDFYQSATLFIGFKGGDEGKTMGLAPYGTDKYFKIFRDAITLENGKLAIRQDFQFNKWIDERRFPYGGQFGSPRKAGEPMRQVDKDIAAAVQYATEEILILLARQAYELTGSKNLCLSGGVALNSVANKKILDATPFENIFVQPAAGDDGCAFGNAFWGWIHILGKSRNWEMRNAYTGREYSETEINKAVEQYKNWVTIVQTPDVVDETSRLIAERKIIGWFQGGSEFGPRALGHRSILCDTRFGEMKDILNAKVKHREGFRPFAPSILEEYNQEYFELDGPSPYMLLIAQVKKPESVPAIRHVDNSARVQTVNRPDNGIFYDLIVAYHKRTGVPVVLNTSFNVDGEPIVETPQDAIRCFLGTHMDYLVLGKTLLRKRPFLWMIFHAWPKDLKRFFYQIIKILFSWFPILQQLKKVIKGKKQPSLKVPG